MGTCRWGSTLLLSAFVAFVSFGCSDSPAGPERPPDPGDSSTLRGLLVSEAIETPGADGSVTVAYVSASPRLLPAARSVMIRNVTTGAAALSPVAIVDGGFDPVAVPASTGDRLELAILDQSGGGSVASAPVPRRRAPVIVRVSPRADLESVPVEYPLRIVFSEPVLPSSLPAGVFLGSGEWSLPVTVVPAEPWVAEVVSPATLEPGTPYQLTVTRDVVDLDGQALAVPRTVRFTTEAAVAFDVDKAGRIAFVSTRDGAPHIYVGDADGAGLARLALGEAPAWSPDGRRLAFQTWSGGVPYQGATEIHVIDVDGSDERLLVGGGAWSPAWSPDGRRVAFASVRGSQASEIFVVNADGSGETELIGSEATLAQLGVVYSLHAPTWSPDGRWLAFVGTGHASPGSSTVLIANADGSALRLLELPSGHGYWGPVWAPDGSRLAVVATGAITTVRLDGSQGRVHAYGSDPDWSSDGRWLVYHRNRSGMPLGCGWDTSCFMRIFVADVGSGQRRQLIPDAVAPAEADYSDYDPAWSRSDR